MATSSEAPSGARARERPAAPAAAPASTDRPAASEKKPPVAPRTPTVLDFFPLEGPQETQLSAFFEHLRAGRFTTTRCPREGTLLWPPRLVCPKCHGGDLEWVDLPTRGRLYAFSAVLAGAPLGMESEVPFSVGLADLEGAPLRLFGRIEGARWDELSVGTPVRIVPVPAPDGRIFYRFRVEPDSSGKQG